MSQTAYIPVSNITSNHAITVRRRASKPVDYHQLARMIVRVDTDQGLDTDFRYAMHMVREYADMGLLGELLYQYRDNTPARQLDELIELGVA